MKLVTGFVSNFYCVYQIQVDFLQKSQNHEYREETFSHEVKHLTNLGCLLKAQTSGKIFYGKLTTILLTLKNPEQGIASNLGEKIAHSEGLLPVGPESCFLTQKRSWKATNKHVSMAKV